MKYNIFIFYKKHTISEKIALKTNLEFANTENISIKLLENENILEYIKNIPHKLNIINIIYIWDRPFNIDYDPSDRFEVIETNPNVYCFTYSEEHRKENLNDTFLYTLAAEIKEVIKDIEKQEKVYYIDRNNLRVFHVLENKYDTEKTLYFQTSYKQVSSQESGKEILKIIIEERQRNLENEIKRLNKIYDNAIIPIKEELKKIKHAVKYL